MPRGFGAFLVASSLLFDITPSLSHATPQELPTVRADRERIRTKAAECKADAEELIDDDSGKMAGYLCKLRADHQLARNRLRAGLAKLIESYKDFTNHDHAKNLPRTIEALQRMVGDCLQALESQQWCHNIVCGTWPEENAILCETKAAQVVDAILRPGLGSVSIVRSTQ